MILSEPLPHIPTLSTEQTGEIFDETAQQIRRTIYREPRLFPKARKDTRGRWRIPAADVHRVLEALDDPDEQIRTMNAFWLILWVGVPGPKWNPNVIEAKHRRIDELSGCGCGKTKGFG